MTLLSDADPPRIAVPTCQVAVIVPALSCSWDASGLSDRYGETLLTDCISDEAKAKLECQLSDLVVKWGWLSPEGKENGIGGGSPQLLDGSPGSRIVIMKTVRSLHNDHSHESMLSQR